MIRNMALSFFVAASALVSAARAEATELPPVRQTYAYNWEHRGVESKDGRWLETFAEDICEADVAQKIATANEVSPAVKFRAEGIHLEAFTVQGTETHQDSWPSNARHFRAWGDATCVYDLITVLP